MRQALKRKITAILAADIAEYTRITAEDEEETLARLESYRMVFDDFVTRSGGRVFNSAGDSVMCEFPSAVEATRCAIDIQESLRTRNMAFPPNRQMHFRIGISIGDVVEREGDLLGDGVNVAARLQSLADPGSICVSRNVQEAVANKISLPFVDLGHREVKNLPHPVHAFQIAMNGDARPVPRPAAQVSAKRRPMLLATGAAIVAGGLGLAWWAGVRLTKEPVVVEGPRETLARPETLAGTRVVMTENLTAAQAYEKLSKSGGLVKDPSSVAELYHNARLLEARGENAAARRDYLALAALGTDHIDPLLRFAAQIRAQDGRAGAREVFAGLAQREGRAARLVHALQFEGAERLRRLAAFAESDAGYAPVHALLAVELGEDRPNLQTIMEKRQELDALTRFLAAEQDGTLVPFFLDQSVLSEWVERARRREASAKAFFAEGRDRVSVHFTPTNTGWMGAVILPEPAVLLEYRLGTDGAFRANGSTPITDPRTGKPMPRTGIEFPRQSTPMEIAFRYTDANGQLSPVTTIAFEPESALRRSQRDTLEQIPTSWVAFGTGHNGHRLYFTTLISYRCAIEKVEFGFNGDAPREIFPLPPCDATKPMQVPPDARISLDIAPTISSAAIRLHYRGGGTSDVKTFARPAP